MLFLFEIVIDRPVMKEHMRYVIEHAEEIDKVSKLKEQVKVVKNIMNENIIQVYLTSLILLRGFKSR